MDKISIYRPKKSLPVITNPMSFKLGIETLPTDDGLFSNKIFGTNRNTRSTTGARIDLHGVFFHPLVYVRVFSRMYKKVTHAIVKGEEFITIVKGDLYIFDEAVDEGLKPTLRFKGVKGFRQNLSLFKPKKNNSITRNKLIDFIMSNKEEMFITDLYVMPPFFRDYNNTRAGVVSDPVNEMYEKVISYSNTLGNAHNLVDDTVINLNLQNTINEVYKYLRDKTKGKHGIIQKQLRGRNVSNGAREVITSAEFDSKQFGKGRVNGRQSGYPLSTICGTFFPFFVYEIKNYMEINYQTKVTTDEIKSNIYKYIKSWSTRLEPIAFTDLDTGEKKTFKIKYTVKDADGEPEEKERDLTNIDLLYIMAERIAKGKSASKIRPPILKTQNVLQTKISVLTTNLTHEVIVDNITYPYYPNVEETLKGDVISSFKETLQISNTLLPSYDGDFDKIKTVMILGNYNSVSVKCSLKAGNC